MRTKLNHFVGMLILGVNLSCASEGRSLQTQGQEAKTMNTPSHGHDQDSGSFYSELSGRKYLNVAIDVAATTLEFASMDKDFKITWKKGESCDRIEVKENPSGLEIKHLDRNGSCGDSKIEIQINEKLATQFQGGTGYLNVKNLDKIMSHADEVQASVMAGQIDSHVGEIQVERKWAGMNAKYYGHKNTGIVLKITMGAGNIVFNR